jgi:hypothetical protein
MAGLTYLGEHDGKCTFKVTQDEKEAEMANFEGNTQPRAIFGMSHGC